MFDKRERLQTCLVIVCIALAMIDMDHFNCRVAATSAGLLIVVALGAGFFGSSVTATAWFLLRRDHSVAFGLIPTLIPLTAQFQNAPSPQPLWPSMCVQRPNSGYSCPNQEGILRPRSYGADYWHPQPPLKQQPIYRFAFNVSTGQCNVFGYSGCGGNGNRFLTAQICQRACQPQQIKPPSTMVMALRSNQDEFDGHVFLSRLLCHAEAFPLEMPTHDNSILCSARRPCPIGYMCTLSPANSPINLAICCPAYPLDTTTRSQIIILTTPGLSDSDRLQICTGPPDIGPCNTQGLAWYFDINQAQCLPLLFGRCQTLDNTFLINRFSSLQACLQTCVPPAVALFGEVPTSPPTFIKLRRSRRFLEDLFGNLEGLFGGGGGAGGGRPKSSGPKQGRINRGREPMRRGGYGPPRRYGGYWDDYYDNYEDDYYWDDDFYYRRPPPRYRGRGPPPSRRGPPRAPPRQQGRPMRPQPPPRRPPPRRGQPGRGYNKK